MSVNNFDSIMQELEAIAQKHAAEYFRLQSNKSQSDSAAPIDSTDHDKIVETFRLLIMPDKTLFSFLKSLGKEEAKKEFRRFALLVHPDKNPHPNAKIAFQKLFNHFKRVEDDSD